MAAYTDLVERVAWRVCDRLGADQHLTLADLIDVACVDGLTRVFFSGAADADIDAVAARLSEIRVGMAGAAAMVDRAAKEVE